MGTFDLFCSFCAGPLEDAHSGWRHYIEMSPNAPWPPKDGEWGNPPGYPVPTKSKEDIVCISSEDGAFWADWVCVGANWESGDWVSPPCSHGTYGEISIDGSSDWQNDDPGRYLIIHRGCLSFACRRLSITPKLLWESLYKPGSDYLRYGDGENGLLYCLKYYEMEGRNGQDFGYAITQQTPREDETECVDRWDDPDSMEDTAWILTRPTCLPFPASIDSPSTATSEPSSPADCMKVFGVPELLDIVLSTITQVSPHVTAEELKKSAADFNPPSLISATQAVLALCQVSRFFHDAITQHHQGLFLHLALQFGWMLPSTPAEWKEWRDRAGPELDLRLDQPLDWRGYLLTFLRMEGRVVKNRWRFHRMAVQCARGRARPATDTDPAWRWSVGELGLPSSAVPPEAWVWEFPPVEG